MRWFLRSLFSCGTVCGLFYGTLLAQAESATEQRIPRKKVVEDTLRLEAQEAIKDRLDLLRPARGPGPAYEPAYWQSGFVYDAKHKTWLQPTEVQEQSSRDARLSAYAKIRTQNPDTIAGHMEVARWCLGKKLEEQARAHLTRVIELNPNQAEARQLLGYRLSKGSWVSTQDQMENQAKDRKAATDLAKWKPKLEQLRSKLQTSSKALRARRMTELEAIRDPAAVGAIDAVFCSRGGSDLQLGISLLENLRSAESAATLARYAVFAPWDTVGKRAAQALRSQRKHDYVPLLLAGMQSPAYSRAEIYQERGSGQAYYRQIFFRDGAERDAAVIEFKLPDRTQPTSLGQLTAIQQAQMANLSMRTARSTASSVSPTAIERSASPLPAASRSNGPIDDGMRTIMQSAMRGESSSSANSSAAELDRRLSSVLKEATGESKRNTVGEWWQWWYDENDCLPPEKAYRPTYVQISLNSWQPMLPSNSYPGAPQLPSNPSPPSSSTSPRACECFAAGTIVWTELGPVPVEKVAMGDRVFACDPETGCLALKVVLRPTVRPPTTLFKINLDSEEIRCTGGHCFWISGSGWVMARDMQIGMHVHTIRGVATVVSIATDKLEPAYNLVVEDFHSYFVGKGKYLTHDNTIRRPTDRLVPGLAANK